MTTKDLKPGDWFALGEYRYVFKAIHRFNSDYLKFDRWLELEHLGLQEWSVKEIDDLMVFMTDRFHLANKGGE